MILYTAATIDLANASDQSVGGAILVDFENVDGSASSLGYSISGNSQDNIVGGGAGADVIQGRTGNDTLYGNDGSDTYRFARGDGYDLIYDYDSGTVSDQDVLSFFSGVARDQLWFTQSGSDLDVKVIGTNDLVRLGGYFSSDPAYKIEAIQAGNQELTGTGIANMISAMASLTPPPFGQTNLSAVQHSQLDSVIAANWHTA